MAENKQQSHTNKRDAELLSNLAVPTFETAGLSTFERCIALSGKWHLAYSFVY